MCTEIYIGTRRKMPIVLWNELSPGFYISELNDLNTISMIHPLLQMPYYYKVGSHMGCACGFHYDADSTTDEDFLQRKQCVKDFHTYLGDNLDNNQIKAYFTSWEEFPLVLSEADWLLSSWDEDFFELEEDIVLIVKP